VQRQSNDDACLRKGNQSVVCSAGTAKAVSGSDDEESIEDYMAKLLQRVRGESAPTTVAKSGHAPEQKLPISVRAGYEVPDSVDADGEPEPRVSLEAIRRKSPALEPQADLEALRALANESARRAITRHAMRKSRRNLGTKMIVSTLAGVTSLWLMLNAKELWNLEFITACVSMLVAAYWAAETLRSLARTMRVATTDETDAEIEQLAAELRAPLPIDVAK
jgi:hypothetical protein